MSSENRLAHFRQKRWQTPIVGTLRQTFMLVTRWTDREVNLEPITSPFRVRQQARTLAEAGGTNRHAILGGSSNQQLRPRRSEFRADRVPAISWIWPFKDREHSLCGRARQPAQGTRHSRDLIASRRAVAATAGRDSQDGHQRRQDRGRCGHGYSRFIRQVLVGFWPASGDTSQGC
jgi:hypothetical protein